SFESYPDTIADLRRQSAFPAHIQHHAKSLVHIHQGDGVRDLVLERRSGRAIDRGDAEDRSRTIAAAPIHIVAQAARTEAARVELWAPAFAANLIKQLVPAATVPESLCFGRWCR